MNSFYKALSECGQEKEIMTATVLDGDNAGEKAIVCEGKMIFPSEGNGFFSRNAEELMSLNGSGIKTVGDTRVFIEYPGKQSRLVVCGCGHVSIPIVKLGKMLKFHVTAIDDRPEFALNAREAGADAVITDTFSNALNSIRHDLFTYYVIVTRGHSQDEECLRILCKRDFVYLGMMGSKRRSAIVKDKLFAEGIGREVLDKIHTPIGLEIGSETPEEIAVSILAEIISVKRGRKDSVFPEEILDAINGTDRGNILPRGGMLATIMNCIYVSEIFRSAGMMTNILTPFECGSFTKLFSKDRANKYFEKGMVVFFAGGTGHPYFSTDTGVVLRAIEVEADGILLAKAIDGVYDSDPKENPAAVKYDTITIQEVIDKQLKVVDLTASILAMENKMPMYVFSLNEENSIVNTIYGEFNGTRVTV